MSIMFEPGRIKNMVVKNRLARSATYEGMADHQGRPRPELAEAYKKLADGEVGLIFTSAAMVDNYKNLPAVDGYVYPVAMDEDVYIDDWRPIVEGVQSRGAKIVMQIVHPGRQDNPKLRGGPAPVPSEVPIPGMNVNMKAMTVDEIRGMVEKFAQAIRRIKQAGFDGVQFHGGHGYLINNFISPYMNLRDDEYGGSTKNRARFVKDTVKRARELVGDDFPIMIKMNCDDFVEGGLDMNEAVEVAKVISAAGIDCIEVTGGIGVQSGHRISEAGINKPGKEAYFKDYAAALKKALDVPVILVGGMRSPQIIEKVIQDNVTDFVSMCRPFIREPGLVKRWKSGDLEKAACISCNKCAANTFKKTMRCYVEEKLKKGGAEI
jgi:2,4-dienoyl-CoA reductase-like NADH-dependent reductase (Old Yellow Enzyme family)